MAYTQPEKEYIQRLFQAQPSLTNDDVRKLIDQRRQKEANMNIPKPKSILGKIWGGLMNVGAGAIQAGGELAVWLPGQLSRLAPWNQSTDQSSFYNKTQRLLEKTKQEQTVQGRDVEWLGFWFGKWVINIAAGSVWAGLVGKWAQALARTGAATNLGTQIANKAPTLAKYGNPIIQGFTWAATKGNLAQKVIWGAATGAREWLWFDLASANTPWAGTVWGAVIWGALPVVWAGLKATWNYLSRTLPWNLQLQGLMNPAKVTMLKKQLQTEWVTSPQDVGKWMLDRGIKWNKETIINTLISRAEKSKQAVDDSLSAIKKTVFSPVAKKALQQTYDDMAKVAGLEDDAAKVLKLLKKDKYTLSELNWVKRILDDQYNLFTKTGDPTAWLKAKWLQTIRQQLRKTIEEVASEAGVKNIRALNNETQIARTMADAIARKDSADAVREALTAFAPTWVGGIIGGVAWPFDNSTIEGKVWNVLLGMLAGKVLGSTTLKTNVASLLNKLSKQEISALDAYIKSGGKWNLPSQIIEKMEAMKLLPPPSWMPLSWNVVDVKPITGYLPGVLQKQAQAISSKVGKQPLTTQQSLQSWATSLLWNKIGLESWKKVSPLKKLKTNADIIGKKTVNAKTPQTKPLSQKSEVKYNPLSKAQEARINSILNTKIRYNWEVMTKREMYMDAISKWGKLEELNRNGKTLYRITENDWTFTELSKYEYEAMKKEISINNK